jgi:O-glycosyl hydrolase
MIVVAVSAACLLANRQVTVTFAAEEQQEFKGFGFNRFNIPKQDESAEDIADLTWKDMDFRVARVGVGYDITIDANYVAAQNKRGIEIAKEKQPNLVLLFNPVGKVVDAPTWADYYAKIIRDLKNDHNIVFEYTGIKNEPNWGDEIVPADIPEYIKFFRRALDSYGLEDVKIIAPEASNVDTKFLEMLDYIIGDPEALEALDCFAYHAYNMCMLSMQSARLRKDF